MSKYRERFPVAGLRQISAHLRSGDVRIERIDGEEVIVEADEPVRAELQEGRLKIGIAPDRHHAHHHEHHGRRPPARVRAVRGLSDTDIDLDLEGLGKGLSDLGVQISEMVSSAVGSIFGNDFAKGGMFGADLRIGVPASLERPAIQVSTSSGDLTAQGITADWHLHSGSGDISLQHCGGALEVETSHGDLRIDVFDGPVHGHSGSGDLQVTGIAGPAALRTGQGDVRLAACEGGGTVHSGTGDLQAERLGGAWELRTGSGDVDATLCAGAALSVVSGSGDVTLEGGALERLQVQTGSGEISCRNVLAGSRHVLVTGSGDINLDLAESPGARLQILTGHGEVNSDYPLVRVGKQGPPSFGSKRFVGNVGNSTTVDVELRTSAGDVTISRIDARHTDRPYRAEPPSAARTSTYTSDFIPTPPIPPLAPIPPIPPIPPMTYASPTAPMEASMEHPDIPSAAPEAPPAPSFSQPVAEEPMPAATGASGQTERDANPRLAVLTSLQRGEISVEEATLLLDALSRRGA